MATIFILLVLPYFVVVCDVSIAEKLVLAALCAGASLLPMFVENSSLPAAIAQGALGVYVCLRMTYTRVQR